MNFFSLELCQEMQKAGLVSESGFWWFKEGKLFDNDPDSFQIVYEDEEKFDCFADIEHCVAFTPIDLIAPTVTARNNAKKWFGNAPCCHYCGNSKSESSSCPDCISSYDTLNNFHRHAIVSLDISRETVEDYVKRTRRKDDY